MMMTTNVNEIVMKLNAARDAYYKTGTPIMSDADFDDLEDQLKKLDPENEYFEGVGEDSIDGFPKAKHTILMGSQAKANTVGEVSSWLNKQKSTVYLVEEKCDGISLELNYNDGVLATAITRGNGVIGDCVTENAKKMKGVLSNLKDKLSIAVRGEVLLFHEDKEKFFPEMKNCRNAASGIFKRLDGKGAEHLSLVVYDIQYLDETKTFESEAEKIALLKELGFITVHVETLKNPSAEKLMEVMNDYTIQKDFGYDIDGVVVKCETVDNFDLRNEERPKTQMAIKPSRVEYKTTLRNIEWTMRKDTLTPVAIFDEVEIDGAAIKRANLSNVSQLEELNLEIGCDIIISRRNMVIPHVERRA